MRADTLNYSIHLNAGADTDPQEREEFARHLCARFDGLNGVEKLERLEVAAPAGSKLAFGVDPQSLMVTLAASGGVLTTLIGLIQALLTNREKASVTVEVSGDKLVITGVSSEAQRRLVDNFLDRHDPKIERNRELSCPKDER